MLCSHGRQAVRFVHSDARHRTIAVLGGGISGVASALELSRKLPAAHIVLVEGDNRLGGYIGSHRESVGTHSPLFERGPRSIRPVGYKGLRTLELLDSVGLTPRLLTVSKSSPSAKNRFIYYGGQLNQLPSSLFGAIKACVKLPLLRTLFPRILKEPWVPKKADADESVHDFMARRLGPAAATNLASAMMHGIYAGDSRELSVKSVLPSLVELEQKFGALGRVFWPKWINSRYTHREEKKDTRKVNLDDSIIKMAKQTSIYSFPNGLGEMVSAIEAELIASPNVSIWKGTPCKRISYENNKFVMSFDGTATLYADRLVSAIPSARLAELLPDLPHLGHNPSAHVGVVDIVLSQPDGSAKLPIEGFGYLVPRAESNPDEILGVVLDSSAIPNQGSTKFVKLTAMIGGPFWRARTTLPTQSELEARALRALEKQLGVPKTQLDSQVSLVRARVLKNTIPQYLVGHVDRMLELREVVNARYPGLTLVGSSYNGVGVNDCIAGALDVCVEIARAETSQPNGGTTGLEDI
ncbi:hypothetical protein MCUN1_000570 [Malassezia cuniculi]|uniref:Protoporphyrinogen oxidase n=1 Tax=Malassezia cuniculi TaxID=948313 RepID=A0AAF0ENC0_9BASI|nr:hypothetical protein MCUN1_000570 [Malassezia cuniculi]